MRRAARHAAGAAFHFAARSCWSAGRRLGRRATPWAHSTRQSGSFAPVGSVTTPWRFLVGMRRRASSRTGSSAIASCARRRRCGRRASIRSGACWSASGPSWAGRGLPRCDVQSRQSGV